MNRTALCVLFSALLVATTHAIGPTTIQVVTESAGVSYRPFGTAPGMSREALAKWVAEAKPGGAQPVLIYVDGATSFYTIADLLLLLKESGGVEQFEVYVSAELAGSPRIRVTHALGLDRSQIGLPAREPLPPPGDTPEEALNRALQATPPPPEPSAPRAK